MAKNRYINDLVGKLRVREACLRSLRFAIERYLSVRRGWLTRSSGGCSYGWRGGWTTGKLFFNRKTTEKNIQLMEEALEHINSANWKEYGFGFLLVARLGNWLQLFFNGKFSGGNFCTQEILQFRAAAAD